MEESKKEEEETRGGFVVDNRWLTFTAASNLSRVPPPFTPAVAWIAPGSSSSAANRFLARLASFGGIRLSGSFFTHLNPVCAPDKRSALCLMQVSQLIPSQQRVVHDTFFEGVAFLVDTNSLSKTTVADIPVMEVSNGSGSGSGAGTGGELVATDVPDCFSTVSVEDEDSGIARRVTPPLPTALQIAVSHVYFKSSANLALTAGPMRMGMGVLTPPAVGDYLLGTMENGEAIARESSSSSTVRPHRRYRLTLQNWVGVAPGTAQALSVIPVLPRLDLYNQRFLFFDTDELGDTMWVLVLFVQAYDSGLRDRMALFETFTKRVEHVTATPDCPAKDRGSTLSRSGFVDDVVAGLERMFNNSAFQFTHSLKAARAEE